jgi:hypothetical protein
MLSAFVKFRTSEIGMKNLCVLNVYSCVGEGRNLKEKHCCEHIGFLSRKISLKGSQVCGSQYLFDILSKKI